MTGQAAYRALISAVTKALKCQVTTTAVHGYSTGQSVRISDIGNMMPIKRGMVQINGGQFVIEVDSTTTFLLKDPITMEYIDSRNYQTYVSGGRTNLENTEFLWVYP
tara:strand:- start:5303 stop:5623 length:321 start_codon:yes stop_codon:yes gene_type:complete